MIKFYKPPTQICHITVMEGEEVRSDVCNHFAERGIRYFRFFKIVVGHARGRKVAFWRQVHTCLICVFVILGSAYTNSAQNSVDNSSSTQFVDVKNNFTGRTYDKLNRTKWTSVQDLMNLSLLKNLTLYLNETQKHIETVYRDFEKVKDDIKSVGEILTEVDHDVSVKYADKYIQENVNDAEESELSNSRARLKASNSAADLPQSETSLTPPDENIERSTEISANLSRNLVVSTDKSISISSPGANSTLPANTTISGVINSSTTNISSTFEDSTDVSEIEHTYSTDTIFVPPKLSGTETPIAKKENLANDTTDKDKRSVFLETAPLQPSESNPVSTTQSVLTSSKIFDDDDDAAAPTTERSSFETTSNFDDVVTEMISSIAEIPQNTTMATALSLPQLHNEDGEITQSPTEMITHRGIDDRTWPTTNENSTRSSSSSTSKDFSISVEQVSLSTTAVSPVFSNVTISDDIVSQKQGRSAENEIPDFDLKYIMLYLSDAASEKGLTKNISQRNVNQTESGPQRTSYVYKRICFKDIDSTSDIFKTNLSEPVDMYVYYHSYAPNKRDFKSSPHVKHRYTNVQSVDNKDLYGAYSLHNHKVVSRYMFVNEKANSGQESVSPDQNLRISLFDDIDYDSENKFFNGTDDESESDIFCVTVPVPVTHVERSKSSLSTNDDIVVIADDSRRQKFFYKKQMPFDLDTFTPGSTQVCDTMCSDSKVCLTQKQICDDIVHCRDLSDEQNCSCRDRMDVEKICDGYHDCPDGKDEEACNCPVDYFFCTGVGSGQKRRGSNCIPMDQRCNNVPDCVDHSDEMNCEVLAETVDSQEDFTIGYTNGYLHRNWQGKWYPVCDAEVNYDWAVKSCAAETGARKTHVDVELLPYVNEYKGYFISKTGPGGRFVLMANCGVRNQAVHVKCPPISCGSRIMPAEYFESGYRSRRHLENGNPLDVMQTLENIEHSINYIRLHLWNDSDDDNRVRYRNIQEGINFLKTSPRNISQDSAEGRVTQGKVSVPANWPWIVAIFRNGNFHCGGTILDENWIMTAAHCFNRYEQHFYEVRAGVLRRLSFSPNEQIRGVSQIILHPNYVSSDMQNDLALIRLETPLNYNRWIRPICLPEARPPWGPTPGTLCTAIGWGSTTEKGTNPDNLREVELPVLPDCKHLPDKQADEICAGYLKGGRDTCQGDSGGPLLCRIPGTRDRWYVAGVISHGEGCARPMEPGAYTRVALYIPWLMQNTDYSFLRASRNPKKDCPGMRCKIGGRCIPIKRICDGVIDCLNAEDEKGCLPFGLSNTNDDAEDCDKEIYYRTLSLHGYKQAQKCKNAAVHGYGGNINTIGRSNNESEYQTPISFNKTTEFLCQKIVQVIPRGWRCDGDVDCEDATDETDCTCVDFLRVENKSLICDGIIHCHDESDERNCLDKPCHETQFYCYKSRFCIDYRTSVCNGSRECPEGEDEDNCYAIFQLSEKGSLMKLDYFEVPAFAEQGIIAKNEKGIWTPLCIMSGNENEINYSRMVYKFLRKLGFKEASTFHKTMMVINGDLQRPNFDINYCQGVSVDLRYAVHKEDYNSLPWHADIYINGEQRCIGLLVHDQWIVANFACCREFNVTEDTVVVVMGGSAKSKIRSPYQQMILADGTNCRSDLGIMVIRLRQTPNVTLHTRILRIPYWPIPQVPATDVCYLIFNHENSKDSVRVKSVTKNCPRNKRCYSVDNLEELCKKSTNCSLLFEGVVCIEKNQWYLSTTVIGKNEYFCTTGNYILELDYLENPKDIFVRRNVSRLESSFSHTRDFLCDLGNRIPWSEVCDGKPDCYYGEDEDAARCSLKENICRSNTSGNDCDCKIGQFKCANDKCISDAFICDGERDCEDGSDEPEQCSASGGFSCAVYLNLTNPSKLCDMRQDCYDKSDEESSVCWSKCDPLLSFNCSQSNKCIPTDFVCDGERNCPDGEDENDCTQLRSADENDKSGNVTVWIRSRGKWQELCVRTEEYAALDEELLCQQFNFSKLLKVREVPRRKSVRDDIFTTVRLNNREEIRIKNRRQKSADLDSTEECSNWNLLCEIKEAE